MNEKIKLKVKNHYLLYDGRVVVITAHNPKEKFSFYGKEIGRGIKATLQFNEAGKSKYSGINNESDVMCKYHVPDKEWWKFLSKGDKFTVDGQIKTIRKVKVILVAEEDKTGFNIEHCIPFNPNPNMILANVRRRKITSEQALELLRGLPKSKGGMI